MRRNLIEPRASWFLKSLSLGHGPRSKPAAFTHPLQSSQASPSGVRSSSPAWPASMPTFITFISPPTITGGGAEGEKKRREDKKRLPGVPRLTSVVIKSHSLPVNFLGTVSCRTRLTTCDTSTPLARSLARVRNNHRNFLLNDLPRIFSYYLNTL